MKKEYESPLAEIEKFNVNVDVCTVSDPTTGNEGGENEWDF